MTIRYLWLGVVAGVLAVPGVCHSGPPQFGCGDTIGPKEKVTLTADIGPCDSGTEPALTIVGPATVDMAGHRVICDPNDPPQRGIVLTGKGVKLRTGVVEDCADNNLQIEGEGKHKVEDFVSMRSGNNDVRIASDKNTLKRVASVDAQGDGWEIDGAKQKLEDVAAINSGDVGFEIDADSSSFKRITAVAASDDGVLLEDGATGNKIKDGAFLGNGGSGLDNEAPRNKIEKSVAVMNGSGGGDSGFDSEDDGNQVKKCRAFANDTFGIRVSSDGQGNTVTKSLALGNVTDLGDNNFGGTCDGNSWKKNVFGTSAADGVPNPACIQ